MKEYSRMEKFLDYIFEDAYIVFFSFFLGSLFLFEYTDFNLINSNSINGIFGLLNFITPLIIVLLTFFGVLSLYRLEQLKRDEPSSKEIRDQLRMVGKPILFYIFISLIILIISLSDKNYLLEYEFVIRLDRLILSFVIAFSAYVFLSAGRSYLNNLKPKDNIS